MSTPYKNQHNKNVEAMVDLKSDILSIMDEGTYRLNAGEQYYSIQRVRGSAAVRKQLIITGAKELHIYVYFKTGLATPVELLEGVTVTDAGTPLKRFNYKRSAGDNGTLSTFFLDPVYTGGESIRPNQAGFGSSPGQAKSDEVRGVAKYIFKPNTNYVLYQTPDASTDTVLLLEYHEEAV